MTGSVLVVTHVPWEGPHRIADALVRAGLNIDHRRPLEGDRLPPVAEVSGAVFMGGPMNVDQVDRHPGLLAEREWLEQALAAGVPTLGICLGAQLLARAAGASVSPGNCPEIGWAPVEVLEGEDPLARFLAPASQVLHWHGDVFELPQGATHLASSERTEVQGFRIANSWGFLFHAEADVELVDLWLAEPSMRDEAERALGATACDDIRGDAARLDAELRLRSEPMFAAFAELIASARQK